MEHAFFLAILLPGAEAASLRRQALRFQRTFRQHLSTVSQAWIDQTNFVALNLQTIDLVLPLVEFKLQLEDAQRSGQIRSLVWPSFASHLAAEGQRFVQRLDTLSRGHIEFDLAELVPFWSRIMVEHSLFVAHLLDPLRRHTDRPGAHPGRHFPRDRQQRRCRFTDGRGGADPGLQGDDRDGHRHGPNPEHHPPGLGRSHPARSD